MSFHTATICADCDPPVVAISTGHGSRCPKCGQVDEAGRAYSEISDGALARRVLVGTAVRSDGDARLLGELARRLLERVGKDVDDDPTGCPHCRAGEPSVWDDMMFHYAHPTGEKLKFCHAPWRERCLRCSASISARGATCRSSTCDPNYRCTCLRHDQGFGTEHHTYACARRYAETFEQTSEEIAGG